MATATHLIVAIAVVAGLYLLLRPVARAYRRFRGTRIVTCPETLQVVGVEVDAAQAARTALLGPPVLRLSSCSRWPERQHCGQECLDQIEAAPMDCLVRTILARWYAGKSCAYCLKRFGPTRWSDHKPALLDPEGRTVQWTEVRAESLPRVLETHRPVCWNCHIAETFRREHPGLVVDRPSRDEEPLRRGFE